MSRIITLLVVLLSLRSTAQPGISPQEYEVVNFILQSEFKSHGIDKSAAGKKESRIMYGASSSNPLTTIQFLSMKDSDYSGILDSTLYGRFLALNSDMYPIDPAKISVKAYNTKTTYVTFSRCYVENELAVVYVGVQYNMGEGEGNIYILERDKKNSSWTIIRTVLQWIS